MEGGWHTKLVEPAQVDPSLENGTGSDFGLEKIPAFTCGMPKPKQLVPPCRPAPVVSAEVSPSDEKLGGCLRHSSGSERKARYLTPKGNPGVIAMPASDLLLIWSLPTKGVTVKFTESNSPLRGPKEMLALKLLDLKSGDFQTVAPYVDPRQRVSFGIAKQK